MSHRAPGLSHVVAPIDGNTIVHSKRHRREPAKDGRVTTPTLPSSAFGGASFTNSGSFVHEDSTSGAYHHRAGKDRQPPPASSPEGRGSRHIPSRDAMDMNVASFNLSAELDPAAAAPPRSRQQQQQQHQPSGMAQPGESSLVMSGAHDRSLDHSMHSSTSSAPPAANGQRDPSLAQHLPGEGVLRFRRDSRAPSASVGSTQSSMRAPLASSAAPGTVARSRTAQTKCIRVLDAPGVSDSAQLLDWSSTNKLAIALGNNVYMWDGDTEKAEGLAEIAPEATISRVRWMRAGTALLVGVQHGPVSIFDTRSHCFIKTLTPPGDYGDTTSISVNGPIVAVATDGARDNVHIFDTRASNALIATFDAHDGGVTATSFCTDEPFYLASGGKDGSVHVWDVRRLDHHPRYSFGNLTGRSAGRSGVVPHVTALLWSNDKRSMLYTGASDGMLRLVDTHARPSHAVVRAVNTGSRIVGIMAPQGTNEIATAHVGNQRTPEDIGGHLQLRRADTFGQLAAFTAAAPAMPLGAVTLAPDGRTVCATQMDQSIKFWSVFEASARERPHSVSLPYDPMGGGLNHFESLR